MLDDEIQAFFDKLAAGNGPAAQQQADKPGLSPAGLDLPADVLADVKAAGADVKDSIKDSPADIGREELGRLPTQDPPRLRTKL